MQALKGLVIGMGLLIVVGMVVLVYGLVQKASNPDFDFFGLKTETSAPVAAQPAAGLAPFGDIQVRLDEGCRVESIQPDGGRLFVLVGPEGPCSHVVTLELATGRVLGNVRFWNAK